MRVTYFIDRPVGRSLNYINFLGGCSQSKTNERQIPTLKEGFGGWWCAVGNWLLKLGVPLPMVGSGYPPYSSLRCGVSLLSLTRCFEASQKAMECRTLLIERKILGYSFGKAGYAKFQNLESHLLALLCSQ